jgi:hypothetical protein
MTGSFRLPLARDGLKGRDRSDRSRTGCRLPGDERAQYCAIFRKFGRTRVRLCSALDIRPVVVAPLERDDFLRIVITL